MSILSRYFCSITAAAYQSVRMEQMRISHLYSIQDLITILAQKPFSFIRGFLAFPFVGLILVGKGVSLHGKHRIKLTKRAYFSDYSSIVAVSAEGVTLGTNFSLGKFSVLDSSGTLDNIGKGITISENVGIGSHSFIGGAGGISIGKDTMIGNYVSMHSENHKLSPGNLPYRLQGVLRRGITIGSNCWIGAKATILDGAFIEDNVVIAAGAVVVSGTYQSGFIYAGVPAKLLRAI